MKKVDISCFALALLLAFGLLYFLGLPPEEQDLQQLQIGLVEAPQKTTRKPGKPKVVKEEKKQEEKAEETQEEKQEKQEKQEKIEQPDNTIEKTIEQTIEEKKEEARKAAEKKEQIRKEKLAALKKKIKKPSLKKLAEPSWKAKDGEEDLDFDKVLAEGGQDMQGSSMAALDGKAKILWDEGNAEPVFPETARKTGKNGAVLLVIRVNPMGEVLFVKVERGSGVPEIDAAIEEVARTWKAKLLHKGKAVSGSFVLRYRFHLK